MFDGNNAPADGALERLPGPVHFKPLHAEAVGANHFRRYRDCGARGYGDFGACWPTLPVARCAHLPEAALARLAPLWMGG